MMQGLSFMSGKASGGRKDLAGTNPAGTNAFEGAAFVDEKEHVKKNSERTGLSQSVDARGLKAQAPVVGVLGSKGGVGATTLALNLAVACAQSEPAESVTLVDANLQQPDVALLLAREPENSLVELVVRADEVNEKMFDACRYEVKGTAKKVGLLSPPLTGEAGVDTSLSMVARCLETINHMSGMWVIDLPNHLDRHLVSMLDRCSVIVLVIEPNLASIAAAKRWLSHFRELGYGKERLLLAVNRAGGKLRLVESRIESAFQDLSLVRIPNAYFMAEECAIEGEPIILKKPKDPYAKAVHSLATALRAVLSHQLK